MLRDLLCDSLVFGGRLLVNTGAWMQRTGYRLSSDVRKAQRLTFTSR